MQNDPFQKSYFRFRSGKIEFKYFQENARFKAMKITQNIKRFHFLERTFSFYCKSTSKNTFQLWFGNRSMFRTQENGSSAIEHGSSLVYSLGPNGRVITILYPSTSNIARTYEDHIYLRIGHYSAHQLIGFLEKDIKDLICYSYVSGFDSEPTWWENARVWWLRRTHPIQYKNEFKKPQYFKYVGTISEFTFRAMIISLLKPIATISAITTLIYFGLDSAENLLSK